MRWRAYWSWRQLAGEAPTHEISRLPKKDYQCCDAEPDGTLRPRERISPFLCPWLPLCPRIQGPELGLFYKAAGTGRGKRRRNGQRHHWKRKASPDCFALRRSGGFDCWNLPGGIQREDLWLYGPLCCGSAERSALYCHGNFHLYRD